MTSGALIHEIILQAPDAGQDAVGQPVTTWTNFATVRADIRDASGRQFAAAQAMQNAVSSAITIRYLPGVTTAMRVLHGADVYDIESILGQDRFWLTLMCVRGKGTDSGLVGGSGLVEKVVPVDADSFGLSDSESAGLLRKFTWASLKAALVGIFAPAAKGVTNGDAHDHNGGDGAQIAYSSLSGPPTLGTSAALDVGTTANKIVQLDSSAKLPAVDGSQLTGLASGVSDHGALTGLADDDHPQYHNDARGDARYSAMSHTHSGTYETAGSVATHAALTTTHGISTFGATLVDDANAATARSTLGLGSAATLAVGTTTGTVAAGDDSRFSPDPAETTSTIGALISGATTKTSPVDADSIGISDSEASSVLKKFTWSAIKTALSSIFATLSGKSGGQTLVGGTGASETLTLQSTAHATKGNIILGTASAYDQVNARLGIGTTAPAAKMHGIAATEQLRLGYDASNYLSTTVSSTGLATFSATLGQYSFAGPSAASATATLGAELVANNSFASDLSGWTAGAGWSWSSGAALHTAGSTATLTQDIPVTSGSTYQLDVTITGRTVGSISAALGSVSVIESGVSTVFTATLSRTVVAAATGSVTLTITPTSDFDGRLDNISLRAVTIGSFPTAWQLTEGGAADMEIRQSRTKSNLSLGRNSGRSITTGSNNANFGVGAGYSLTTGNGNTNYGTNAGFNIVTGTNNTSFGLSAGYSLTTGNGNANFGTNAGLNIVTGNNNSIFGLNSGRFLADGATQLTTATNGCYIGALAKASANGVTAENSFGSNAIGIGSNTTCIGASSNTKTQIYGDIILDKTVTASGTTGAQTINKTIGSVNFAAAATSLVVTNNRVTTASVIIATVATNDATLKSVVAVAASGSFTLTANSAATAETRVNFMVIN